MQQHPQPTANGATRSPLTSNSPQRGGDPRALAGIMLDLLHRGPQPGEAEELPAPGCPRCDDRGFWYPALSPDDPGYGKVQPCTCSLARLEAEREARMFRSWDKSGVPKRLRDARLATHPNLIEGENVGLMEQILTADREKACWFLYGEPGRGKSGVAVGYAWEFMAALGRGVVFRTVPDLFHALRASYEDGHDGPSEAQILDEARYAPLLILDDLGKEQKRAGSEWVADRLYTVVGGRHSDLLPTIFTCNGDVDITERYGQPLVSRIREMCGEDHIIELKGRDLRVRRGGPL